MASLTFMERQQRQQDPAEGCLGSLGRLRDTGFSLWTSCCFSSSGLSFMSGFISWKKAKVTVKNTVAKQ